MTPDCTPTTVGARLRSLREDHDMSIEQLARILQIAPGSITPWEHDRFLPRTYIIMRYSEYFHVTTDWILFGR